MVKTKHLNDTDIGLYDFILLDWRSGVTYFLEPGDFFHSEMQPITTAFLCVPHSFESIGLCSYHWSVSRVARLKMGDDLRLLSIGNFNSSSISTTRLPFLLRCPLFHYSAFLIWQLEFLKEFVEATLNCPFCNVRILVRLV